jgi:hypothetical protein
MNATLVLIVDTAALRFFAQMLSILHCGATSNRRSESEILPPKKTAATTIAPGACSQHQSA